LLQYAAKQQPENIVVPGAAGMDGMMGRVKSWFMGNY